jgi:hypothetical protein
MWGHDGAYPSIREKGSSLNQSKLPFVKGYRAAILIMRQDGRDPDLLVCRHELYLGMW